MINWDSPECQKIVDKSQKQFFQQVHRGQATRDLHEEILQGAAVPRHIPADRSGHDVPRDQPQLVVDEILRLRGFLGR